MEKSEHSKPKIHFQTTTILDWPVWDVAFWNLYATPKCRHSKCQTCEISFLAIVKHYLHISIFSHTYFSKNLHCSEMRMLAWWTKMSCCPCLRSVRFVRSQSWIDQTADRGFSLAWSTDLCERHGTRRLAPCWNHGEVSLVSSFVHDIFHRFWKNCCSHSSRFPLLSSVLHICNHRHILMLQKFLNWWWLDGEVFDPFDSGKIGFQASAVIWTLCEYAMSRNMHIKRWRVVFTCLYARTNYVHMNKFHRFTYKHVSVPF